MRRVSTVPRRNLIRIHAFVVREVFLFLSFFEIGLFLLILLKIIIIVIVILLAFVSRRTVAATATRRWLAILVRGIPTGRRRTDAGLFTTSSRRRAVDKR